MGEFKGSQNYVASEELLRAANIAMVLQKPLLIKGEPGTGKTMLAEAVAKALGKRLIIWNIKSTTKAQEGLYVYDTIQRLYDGQFGEEGVDDIAHYIKLGKAAGVQMLRDTLSTMPPQQKPGEVINLGKQSAPGAGEAPKTYTKLSEVPEAERLELRKNNRAEYMRLFKEEYGVECPALD